MAAMQQPTAPPDAALEAEPEVKRVRHARHTGRFKRREAGKRVRHYSADDLTAILGGRPQGGGASHSDKGGLQEATERAASPETPSASEPPKPTSSDSPRPEGMCCVVADVMLTGGAGRSSLGHHLRFYRRGYHDAVASDDGCSSVCCLLPSLTE